MFKSVDLPTVVQFAVMFHNDKPVDWLLDPIIETKFCPHDKVRIIKPLIFCLASSALFGDSCVLRFAEKVQLDPPAQVDPLQAVTFPARWNYVVA